MKKENNKESLNSRKRFFIYGFFYIAFCLVILLVTTFIINGLIEKNSVSQMNETVGLIAEKVNISFDLMSEYVELESGMLSVREDLDFEKEYSMLRKMVDDMDYISVGLIDSRGNMYCSEGERIDLTKYEYDRNAMASRKLYITEPYLSCVTGSNVITMFSPVYNKNEYAGNLFVTYPLESVQSFAKSNILNHDVESYLMNGISANYITCSNSKDHTAGVWGNLSLLKNDISCISGYDFNAWIENMANNSSDNVLCYKIDDIEYTQAYVKINCMENWYVVVRLQNTKLTDTMHKCLTFTAFSASILIVVTLLFAFMLYFGEYRQKKKVEVISEYDPLTDLLNRRAFSQKIEKLFDSQSRIKNSVYIFADIDYFKEVNDNHGHAVGDEVLQKVSEIMKNVFGEYGYISRIGGDEFNLFLPDIGSDQRVEKMIKQYQAETKAIVLSDGTALPIQCSIGVARYVNDTDTLSSLTLHADEALYYVKRNGKNNFCWYSDIKDND